MYAHQVIEDLKKERSLKSNGPELVAQTIKNIQICQNFFAESESKDSIIKTEGMWFPLPNFKDEIPGEKGAEFDGPRMPEDLTGVKMPYSDCFFSFIAQDRMFIDNDTGARTTNAFKACALASNSGHESPDAITIYVFIFLDQLKVWQLSPFGAVAQTNADFSDHQELARMFVLKDVSHHKPINRVHFMSATCSAITLFYQTLKVLSCKNIETIDNPPPDKLNKKRIKSGKQPIFTYKTLVIKPTGKQQASIPRHLWENRIHLCRGHFKTYTEDAPLFGKFTGRYWWQPSVRGRNKDGVVMKDYKVEA